MKCLEKHTRYSSIIIINRLRYGTFLISKMVERFFFLHYWKAGTRNMDIDTKLSSLCATELKFWPKFRYLCGNVTFMSAILYTVFYQIHALARTQKNPEGRLYSGLNQPMSSGFGDCKLEVSFLMRADRAFMCTELTEIIWLLVILDL